MATYVQGTEVEAALKFNSSGTWGTAEAAGAGDGIYVKTPGDTVPEREEIPDEAVGSSFMNEIDYGNSPELTEDITMDMYYEGMDIAMAMGMGTAGAPSQIAATAAYDYTYTLKDETQGQFGTYVVRRAKSSGDIFEYPSLKMLGFEMTGEAGQAIQLALKNSRNTLVRNSVVNTTTTFGNVTFPDKLNRIMFNQGVFRINKADAGALGVSDEVCPSSFTLSMIRALEGDFCADGNEYAQEPLATGMGEVLLTMEFPNYEKDLDFVKNFLTAANEDSPRFQYKADVTFTGADIEAGNLYTAIYSFPKLHLTVPQTSTPGPGKIPVSLSFKGLVASSAPTGMSGITQPIHLTGINKRTTDALA